MVEPALPTEVILITGITGYLGSWVGKQILDLKDPRYKIRASVRSLQNQAKLAPLRKAYGEEGFASIEFVEADLMSKEALTSAIAGVSHIIHVASPLPGAAKLKDEDMIVPAVEGMKAILEAAQAQRVKKLIVTSSLATVIGGVWKKDLGETHYSEKDVAPPEGADGYGRSKIAQEKVIRDFIAAQGPAAHKIDIVTLHPTMIVGPTMISERVSTPEGIAKIMNRNIPGIPNMTVPTVDVRDVALAHVRALQTEGLHGKRIIINKESLTMVQLADILDAEFAKFGYRVQTRRIGYCPLKLASFWDDQVKVILPMIGVELTADNNLSKQLLGLTYADRDLKQSVIEMGYSLIDMGLVPEKRKH